MMAMDMKTKEKIHCGDTGTLWHALIIADMCYSMLDKAKETPWL